MICFDLMKNSEEQSSCFADFLNSLFALAEAALDSSDSPAALQTDLHGDLATSQATHDRFGHAPGEGLFLVVEKLAPFLSTPPPDLETCTSKVRRQPCQSSHPKKAEPLHPPTRRKHSLIVSLPVFGRCSTSPC